MTPALTPAGDLRRLLPILRTARSRRWCLADLPAAHSADIQAFASRLEPHMALDPHVGPLLEGSVTRVGDAIRTGQLARLTAHDLGVIETFLSACETRGQPVVGGRR